MPTISKFFGIIVRMYYFDDRQHRVPHIHTEYAGDQAVFDIADGHELAGSLPSKQTRLVRAWIENTVTSSLRTGTWRSVVRKSSRSTRCGN